MTVTLGSLFTGTGALDDAARAVLGCDPVWFADNDPAASALLAHHHPDVPNLGDITAVDWSTVEPVDILGGGFPCQDVSTAGRRIGMAPGSRSGLWSHMAYAVSRIRPRLVVIENVRGLLSAKAHSDVEPCPGCMGGGAKEPPLRALGAVLGDLANLGYDAVWCGLRASDVGAPHRRYRIFITAADTRSETLRLGTGLRPRRPTRVRGRRPDNSPIPTPADAEHGVEPERARTARRAGEQRSPVGGRPGIDGSPTADVVHEWGDYEPAIRRWETIVERTAPPPTVDGRRGGRVLNPMFVEWMMGLPTGHITNVPGLSRTDMLKLGGNGVVPHQAEAALRHLVPLLPGAVAA